MRTRRQGVSYVEELRQLIGHRKIINAGVPCHHPRRCRSTSCFRGEGASAPGGFPAGGVELDQSRSGRQLCREVVKKRPRLTVIKARPLRASTPTPTSTSVTYPNGDQAQPFTVAFLVEEWSGTPTSRTATSHSDLQVLRARRACRPPSRCTPPHRTALRRLPAATRKRARSISRLTRPRPAANLDKHTGTFS